MARFNAKDADNYGGQGGGGFFSLKNDKDVATVRFMYNTLADVEGYAVHEIELDGKKRYVNCLREYNDPIDVCPLCADKYKVLAKVFVHLFDEETQEVKVWDRGKTFFTKLSSLCARYNPLVSTPFEIERNGKKGDTSTTYETFALESDDITLDDLPEVPALLGSLILDKSAEELEYFLDNGEFEDDGNGDEEAPSRNPRADRKPAAQSSGSGVRRRTPSASPEKAPSRSDRAEKSERTTSTRPGGRSRNNGPTDKF